MNALRLFMWIIGVALVLVAAWMFLVFTGLNKWVPATLLTAGVVLFIGLAIISFAERGGGGVQERRVEHIDEHHHHD